MDHMAVPALPRIDLLIARSERLADPRFPGLKEQAQRWHADAALRRKTLSREAHALAAPRIWPDTIAALAKTGKRMVTTAAPDAPVAILTAAAGAVGLPVAPPPTSRGTIDRAQRLVRAGGPAYVKLGQFIATANGILPDEWVEAFAWCRDEAPALRPGVAQRIVDRELGDRRDQLAWLDDEPLAAGSIGQVHRGRLLDGTDVVVKVRRPRLYRRFRADIETLALVSAAAERLHPAARSANLSGFVELFSQLVLEELDFRLEAANLVDSSAVLEALGADDMLAPRPIPGMVTERLLVMEFLPGVSYARLDPGALAGPARKLVGTVPAAAAAPPDSGGQPHHGLGDHSHLDGEQLLYRGIKGVLEATLVHGVFHGDLHAGNVLIDPATGDFSLVDFGIAGRLDDRQRAGLVQFLVAFATSDAAGQVAAMATFGAIDRHADTSKLVAELQRELDRLDGRERGEVTFDQLGITLGRLLAVLAAGGFQMPKDLVLFFKNLLYLSGFAASVAPRADVLAVVTQILMELFAREDTGLAELVATAMPGAEPQDVASAA